MTMIQRQQIEFLGHIDLVGIISIVIAVLDIVEKDDGQFELRKFIKRLRQSKIIQSLFCGNYNHNARDFKICNMGKPENFLLENKIPSRILGTGFTEFNVYGPLKDDLKIILDYSGIIEGRCRNVTRNTNKINDFPFSNNIVSSLDLKNNKYLINPEDKKSEINNELFQRIELILKLARILLKEDIFKTILQNTPAPKIYKKFKNPFNFATVGLLKNREDLSEPVLFILSYIQYEGKELTQADLRIQILQCFHEFFQKNKGILEILNEIRPGSKDPISHLKTIIIKPTIKSETNDIILFQAIGFPKGKRELNQFPRTILPELRSIIKSLNWEYTIPSDDDFNQLDLRDNKKNG